MKMGSEFTKIMPIGQVVDYKYLANRDIACPIKEMLKFYNKELPHLQFKSGLRILMGKV